MIPNFEEADDIKEILERFVPAASKIMLEHELVLGARRWAITALELYLWTGKTWRDPCTDGATHGSDHGQAKHGAWYIHRGRNPNFGRIDITAGNGRGIIAGILIRELDNEDGSSKSLQKIIRGNFTGRNNRDKWNCEELKIIESINGSYLDDSPLKLAPITPKANDLWIGPRVFRTKNPKKKAYLEFPLRVATWTTKKSIMKMQRWSDFKTT